MLKLTHQEKRELTRMVMELLDDWGVNNSDKHSILALPSNVRVQAMRRYYQEEAFPEDKDVLERIEHLLGIADALRTSFPLNEYMAAFWLNQQNSRFNNQSPINFMLETGLQGVIAVRAHLDCAWDWHRSEQ